MYVQRLAQVDAPGLVSFITAVAYHFRPSLPAAFTQPGTSTLADLCTTRRGGKFEPGLLRRLPRPRMSEQARAWVAPEGESAGAGENLFAPQRLLGK